MLASSVTAITQLRWRHHSPGVRPATDPGSLRPTRAAWTRSVPASCALACRRVRVCRSLNACTSYVRARARSFVRSFVRSSVRLFGCCVGCGVISHFARRSQIGTVDQSQARAAWTRIGKELIDMNTTTASATRTNHGIERPAHGTDDGGGGGGAQDDAQHGASSWSKWWAEKNTQSAGLW